MQKGSIFMLQIYTFVQPVEVVYIIIILVILQKISAIKSQPINEMIGFVHIS